MTVNSTSSHAADPSVCPAVTIGSGGCNGKDIKIVREKT